MQHSSDASRLRFPNDRTSIVLRFSGVDDDRLSQLAGERDLGREGHALSLARRIVVVIIESALPDRDGRIRHECAQLRDVPRGLEDCRVVWMDSRGREDKFRIVTGDLRGYSRRIQRLPDANDRDRARIAGARDYRVAVAGERRVREVGVAVDEDWRTPVLRGHLRSIQSSTGAAT